VRIQAHGGAAVCGQAVPQQRGLLAAQEAAQLSQELPDEAVRGRPLQQGLLDLDELGVRQPWRWAARPAALQPFAAGLPAGMPDTDSLGRDAELAGDLSLTDIGGEQLGRAQPAALEPIAFSLRSSPHPQGRPAGGQQHHDDRRCVHPRSHLTSTRATFTRQTSIFGYWYLVMDPQLGSPFQASSAASIS
jgi:hypothetical protein